MEIQTNKEALDIIKFYEGLRLKAYQDTGKVWTIGYGSTQGVYPGMVITEDQANDMLLSHVAEVEKQVSSVVKVPLNNNQFSALVSFTYNLGIGSLEKSTLLKDINDGNLDSAANKFLKWVYDNKRFLPGLKLRREKERDLFLKPY